MCIGLLVMTTVWGLLGYVGPMLLHPAAATTEGVGPEPSAHELRGTLGDQFGAVNALFSGLALVGIVVALWLQQRELRQAIREHRDASDQHTRMIKTQVLLSLMDEIRSQAWGAAHREVANWQRRYPTEFEERFRQERNQEGTEAHALDLHRRVLINPFHKLQRLWDAQIIDDEFVRIIMTPDAALTLLRIIEPLERAVRPNYGRGIFKMAKSLYPDEADLEARGSHPGPPPQSSAPPPAS